MAEHERRRPGAGFLRRLLKILGLGGHGDVRRFDEDLKDAGDLQGTTDTGVRSIDVKKVVGSVGRWKNLGSDFFYKHGKAITKRFLRVGEALKQGKALPAIELYKIRRRGKADESKGDPPKGEPSRYYVVDGHHRVAMARKLGQDFLDAHIVEYKVNEKINKKDEPKANTESVGSREESSAQPEGTASGDENEGKDQSSPEK